MSFRNVISTSFLYASTQDVKKLEEVLKGEFDFVHSHMDHKEENVSHGYFTMVGKDLDDYSLEHEWMKEIIEKLNGIIQHDWNLVVAWENDNHKEFYYRIKGYLDK